MNNRIACFASLTIGFVSGAAVMARYLKAKYEKILQEEIDSVKEVLFSEEFVSSLTAGEEEPEKDIQNNPVEGTPGPRGESPYTEYLKRYSTNDDGTKVINNFKNRGGRVMDELSFITPITPDEYGVYATYEQVSLTYFNDGVLVDDMDNVINDVYGTLGSNFEDRFGENDDPDVIYIRNDNTRCEYEITRDPRSFKEVVGG